MAKPDPGHFDAGFRGLVPRGWLSPRRSPLLRALARIGQRFRTNRHRKTGTVLSGEGWYYLLVLAFVTTAALLREMNLMLVLVGMLLGPLLLSWRLVVLTLRRTVVRRELPGSVCVGDLLVVNLELANTQRGLGTWGAVLEDEIRAEAGPARGHTIRPTVFFLHVRAGQSRVGAYRGRLAHRGRYRLGPIRMATRFPFGLFRHWVTVDRADTLTVFPRLGRLTKRWAPRHHEAFEGTPRRERRHSRVTGEFYGIREWHDGDSLRWVHWRASARHGKLVVRQFEQHRNRDVAVLVDLWQPECATESSLERVELAVSFAATVVADLCRKGGSTVTIATTGQQPTFVGGPASMALLQGAMENLAVAEASSSDHLPTLLEHVVGRIRPGTEVVLVSTRDNDLADSTRFPGLRHDPAARAFARQIRVVNTAAESLAEYFQADQG